MPISEIKYIDARLAAELTEQARKSPRRRAHHNLHQDFAEPVQRLCCAMEPDSYIPVHRHLHPPRWELFVALVGGFDLLVFDEPGQLQRRNRLSPGAGLAALELPEGCWHTLLAHEPGSLFLEVKAGPYDPQGQKELAPWAPPEGSAQAEAFLTWARTAAPGARFFSAPG